MENSFEWIDRHNSTKDNTKQIIFIKDNNTKYQVRQIDNIRLRTTDNKLADNYIALAEAKYVLLDEGERSNQNGLVQLAGEVVYIDNLINEMLNNNKTRNSLCFCGQNKKYKHCHGKDLIQILKNLE